MAAPRAHRTSLGSYEFRPGTGHVSLSASLRQMAGTAQPLLPLDVFLTLVHPDDRSQVTAVMCRAGGPGPRVASCRFRRESGDLIFTVLRADASRRGDSHDVLLSGLVLDLTPGYESYKAVRQSPDEAGSLAAVVAESAVPLLLSDGTRLLASNHACAALTGPMVPGAEIRRRDVGRQSAWPRWRPRFEPGRASVRGSCTCCHPTARPRSCWRSPIASCSTGRRPCSSACSMPACVSIPAPPRTRRSAACRGRRPRASRSSRPAPSSTATTRSPKRSGAASTTCAAAASPNSSPAATAPAVAQDLAADSGDPRVWHFVHRDGHDVVLEARVRPGPAGDRRTRVLALRDVSRSATAPITR